VDIIITIMCFSIEMNLLYIFYRVGQKNRTFLNVDNFTMVSGRKAYDMSKVCKFCLEKSIKIA